jgi:hypothetical protein
VALEKSAAAQEKTARCFAEIATAFSLIVNRN